MCTLLNGSFLEWRRQVIFLCLTPAPGSQTRSCSIICLFQFCINLMLTGCAFLLFLLIWSPLLSHLSHAFPNEQCFFPHPESISLFQLGSFITGYIFIQFYMATHFFEEISSFRDHKIFSSILVINNQLQVNKDTSIHMGNFRPEL